MTPRTMLHVSIWLVAMAVISVVTAMVSFAEMVITSWVLAPAVGAVAGAYALGRVHGRRRARRAIARAGAGREGGPR